MGRSILDTAPQCAGCRAAQLFFLFRLSVVLSCSLVFRCIWASQERDIDFRELWPAGALTGPAVDMPGSVVAAPAVETGAPSEQTHVNGHCNAPVVVGVDAKTASLAAAGCDAIIGNAMNGGLLKGDSHAPGCPAHSADAHAAPHRAKTDDKPSKNVSMLLFFTTPFPLYFHAAHLVLCITARFVLLSSVPGWVSGFFC